MTELEKKAEESSKALLERNLTHRIEHYSSLAFNANLAGQREEAEANRQIVQGLSLQYFGAFKRYYISTEARKTEKEVQ